jgi:hypothetical protein
MARERPPGALPSPARRRCSMQTTIRALASVCASKDRGRQQPCLTQLRLATRADEQAAQTHTGPGLAPGAGRVQPTVPAGDASLAGLDTRVEQHPRRIDDTGRPDAGERGYAPPDERRCDSRSSWRRMGCPRTWRAQRRLLADLGAHRALAEPDADELGREDRAHLNVDGEQARAHVDVGLFCVSH